MLGFSEILSSVYCFKEKDDPILHQFIQLGKIAKFEYEMCSGEVRKEKKCKYSQRMFKRLASMLNDLDLVFLLQLLEPRSPEVIRQALNSYFDLSPLVYHPMLLYGQCMIHGTLEVYRAQLNRTCVLEKVLLQTRQLSHLISEEKINVLRNKDVEKRMDAVLDMFKNGITTDEFEDFLALVGLVDEKLESDMKVYCRDYYTTRRARYILQWNQELIQAAITVESHNSGVLKYMVEDGFITSMDEAHINAGRSEEDRVILFIDRLCALKSVKNFEDLHHHIGDYDPELCDMMTELLHLYPVSNIQTQDWSRPIQDMWDYDIMEASSLDSESELFGAGPFASMSSLELVHEWCTRFKAGAGGANGDMICYPKHNGDSMIMIMFGIMRLSPWIKWNGSSKS